MIETYQALYSIPARRRESIKEQAARLVAEDRAGCPHQAGRQIAAHFALPVPVVPEVGMTKASGMSEACPMQAPVLHETSPVLEQPTVAVQHGQEIFLAAI